MPELRPNRLVMGLAAPASHDAHAHGRADLLHDLLIHLGGHPRHD